jgi:hypothetical protein
MLKQFFQTFTVTLLAKSAATVAVVILTALGYYNDFGAYLMAWLPHITPEIARIIFWSVAVVLAFWFLALPWLVGPKHRDLWAERDQLELSAIACISVGKTADQPYDVEPQLSRHRLLKDAIRNGSLRFVEMAGDKPNVHTLVSREHLREYARATGNSDLLQLIAKWDRIKPPHKRAPLMDPPSPPAAVTGPNEIFEHVVTQYVPGDVPARLLIEGWWLQYNPNNPNGKKELVFNADGTFGEGGNDNEFKWQMKNGLLEIHRKNKILQNRFRYDPPSGKFICTNDLDAEGYPNQTIYRPKKR